MSSTMLKLRSNIMDIICRICLKMNKVKFNIFEHSQSNKLISDMILEFTSIEVLKGDGFPKNICNNCLQVLNSAHHFKTIAVESDMKLRSFYSNKSLENNTQNKDLVNVMTEAKEECSIVKLEKSDTSLDVNDNSENNSNYRMIVQDTIFEKENLLNKSKGNMSMEYKSTENEEKLQNGKCLLINNVEVNTFTVEYDEINEANNDTILKAKHDSLSESSDILEDFAMGLQEASDEFYQSCGESNHSADSSKFESGNVIENSYLENEVQPILLENSIDGDPQASTLDITDLRDLSGNSTTRNKNLKVLHCKQCNRSFGYRYYLGVHIHQHTANRAFKCDVCSKIFLSEIQLKNHKAIHSDNKPFICETCGKSFKSLSAEYAHRKTHSDERPYKCTMCDKSFKFDGTLKSHMKRHENIKKFVCEHCGKSFIEKSSLLRHVETHNTDKNCVCTACGKRFSTKSHLQGHMRQHSEFKPYACPYCDKRFHYREVLKNHVLVHTGAKPFSCEVCGKTFRQRNCVPRHMRIHTGETPYPCTLCPSSFKYSHHLRNHVKVHHKEVSQEAQVSKS